MKNLHDMYTYYVEKDFGEEDEEKELRVKEDRYVLVY